VFIKKIIVENFKSFKRLEVDLNKFNILIGPNASGKSNFIHIFEFLRDIERVGLEDAISLQGDLEYIRNINIGASQKFSLEFVSDYRIKSFFPVLSDNGIIATKAKEVRYKFALQFFKTKAGFKIVEDRFSVEFDLVKEQWHGKRQGEEKKIGEGQLSIHIEDRRPKYNLKIPGIENIKKEQIFPFVETEAILEDNELLINTPLSHIPFALSELFSGISIYNFDPKQPKRAALITGMTELEEDGKNLAISLKRILDDKNSKERFLNLITTILSFVKDFEIEKLADKSLIMKINEIYANKYLPASLLSDGTINITMLILAIFFEKKPVIIMEEPERNIHPQLIALIVGMMKEKSQEKQIILTTHNTDILKNSSLEDILFISRDHEGYSNILKPSISEQVKIFLKNEMGVDELFSQNLLDL
jgi:predicted ATPase